MGGAPYTGPRLGDGPIFDISVSRLYVKERPGKLSTLASQGCIQDFFLGGGGGGGGEGRSHGRLTYVYAPLPCVYTSK